MLPSSLRVPAVYPHLAEFGVFGVLPFTRINNLRRINRFRLTLDTDKEDSEIVAQAWKCQRLVELGFGIPERLQFVPVDFEAGGSWWERLETVRL
jgi:hypothetical protein